MRLELRVDGATIMRPGPGHQKLLVASHHQAEVVILSAFREVVSCKRHFDESIKKTVPCQCAGPCYSQRTDRFLAVLYRVGPTLWDERVLILPAMGWQSLVQTAISKGLDHQDLKGLRCMIRRTGDSINGRTTCSALDRVKALTNSEDGIEGFDLLAGIRNCTGIAADFFGDADGDLFPPEIAPSKLRLPLGANQRRK